MGAENRQTSRRVIWGSFQSTPPPAVAKFSRKFTAAEISRYEQQISASFSRWIRVLAWRLSRQTHDSWRTVLNCSFDLPMHVSHKLKRKIFFWCSNSGPLGPPFRLGIAHFECGYMHGATTTSTHHVDSIDWQALMLLPSVCLSVTWIKINDNK